MPNFSSLAGLEVVKKMGAGGVGWVSCVATVPNSNDSCFKVALS